MKKAVIVLMMILVSNYGFAQGTNNAPKTGSAAIHATDYAVNWGVLSAGAAVMGTVMGFIFYLADSDPTQFSH